MLLDNVNRFERDHLCPLHPSADGSAKADLKLLGLHSGENFRTHCGEQIVNERSGSQDVDRDQGPAKPEDELQVPAVKGAKFFKGPFLVAVPCSYDPGGKYRHE